MCLLTKWLMMTTVKIKITPRELGNLVIPEKHFTTSEDAIPNGMKRSHEYPGRLESKLGRGGKGGCII